MLHTPKQALVNGGINKLGPFKMITAHEARELSALSDKTVNEYLEIISKWIKEDAARGSRVCYTNKYINGSPFQSISGAIEIFNRPTPTIFQSRIIDELRKLGFSADLEKYGDQYVPKGSHTDCLYQNYSIVIRW